MTDASQDLTALDWIAVALVVPGVVMLLSAGLTVGTSFAEMFKEFGAIEQLPALTRFALHPWAPLVLALPAAGALVGCLFTRALALRRALVAVAFVAMLIGWCVYLYAMYRPMFSLTEAVH